MSLPRRLLGDTGIEVTALGFGAMEIGGSDVDEHDAEALLLTAVDLGINLFDAARSYGLAEERLGRCLASRRDRVVLSTKLGYGIDGVPDWTGPCVTAGVDAALRRLRTDFIDVLFLHSCGTDVLENDDVISALVAARQAGKTRAIGYSGDNEPLETALGLRIFDCVQTSINLVDQHSLRHLLPHAAGIGVIGKRALAGAPWHGGSGSARGDYGARFEALAGQLDWRGDWNELALRYAVWAPGVQTSLVGTRREEHLRDNVAMVAKGPLPRPLTAAIHDAFDRVGEGWAGEV